ncbi:MAG: class I SAM-dependent methyltransferase, partial [Acidimicrobiales bacterium]
ELESTGQPSLKRQDAAEALTMIADAHVPAPSFPADHEPVRRSVFFRKRCLEVACEPLPFTGSWLPAREARIQRAAGAPLDRTLLTELARGLAAVEAIARARNLAATEPWTALTGDDDFQLGSEPGTESWCEGRDLSQTEARMAAARLAAIHELVSIAGATAGWPTHLHGLLRIHGAHASLPASLRTSDPSKLETVADARFRTFRHLAKLWAVIDRAAVDRGLDGRRLPDTALIAEFREARELLRPQDLAEWLEVNEIDEDGLRELIRSEARIRFVTDNLQLLGTADQALDVAWVSDALLIVESGPAKATPRPPGPPRTLWTAEEGLRLAYELIHEELLPEHPDLFSRMASRSPTETDPIAAGVRALLLDLNEHLFCAATDARRRVAIERHATGRVLDHGCGAGFHTVELAERGHPVSAVDTDEVKLRYLRHVAGRRGLTDRIDFVWCGGYDTVLSINVLDHLADASDLVSELAASLVPGGRLLLYAHFTDDGSHTSDDEIVSRVFSALTADLDRPVPQPGAELEVWIRRQPGPTSERPLLAPSAADVNRLDRLHPHAHPELVSGRRRGTTVVGGDRFYLRPTELSPTATELLGHCDGRLSVAQIAVAMASSGTSLETVREISLQLWSRHLIWMQRPVPE